MPAQVDESAPSPTAPLTTPDRHARRGWFLLAVAAFNLWLWITRIWNLTQDPTPRTTEFVVGHAVLYGVSIAIALAVGVLGWRMRREAAEARR